MCSPAIIYGVYLLLLFVNASPVFHRRHRWQPIQSSFYRKALAKVLINECNTNRCLIYQIKDPDAPFARFEDTCSCLELSPITIQEYLSAMYHNLHFSDGQPINDEIFVIVMLYMGRVMDRTKIKATYWNVHRLLAISTWMACKMHYDIPYDINVSAVRSFGLDAGGMNSIQFLIGASIRNK